MAVKKRRVVVSDSARRFHETVKKVQARQRKGQSRLGVPVSRTNEFTKRRLPSLDQRAQ